MFNENSEIIILKDDLWLERQKIAGKAVAACLKNFAEAVRNCVNISLKDIELQSVKILEKHNCTPTFFNYEGFPGAVCISVNEDIVHGIPTDYILQDGDVVTLDLGATYEGSIADAAFTCIHGLSKDSKHKEMLKLCQESLIAGVEAFKIGNRIGAIGAAIYLTAKDNGFGIVDEYGGHGINYNQPHSPPFVPNKAHGSSGVRIRAGMSIAIEPMLIIGGSNKTKVLKDGWTVAGKDVGCHFEHSVTIDLEGNKHIITDHGVDVMDYV